MALLSDAFEQSRGGRSAAVVIGGESGVGKTRLTQEFVGLARRRGVTVLLGGCIDFGEEGPSYWPFIEAMHGLVRTDDEPGDAVVRTFQAQLASALPELPARDPPLPGGTDLAAAGQVPLFELALRVVTRLADQSPLILVIEDLHWADRSTRDLMAFLLANLIGDRVMVIATYRSDAVSPGHWLHPLLAELRRNRRAEFVDLDRFNREELVAQLTDILGRAPDDEMVEVIWARSDGNPFMVEELVAAMEAGYGTAPPPTLRHILLSRVEMLSTSAQRVLRLVAVGGDGVTDSLLAAVAGVADGFLLDSLRECIDHHVLAVAPDGQTYRFRHSLLQEVIYEELLPGERTLFHAAYGRAMSQQRQKRDSVAAAKLAHHWFAAGDVRRALIAALDAATAAAEIYGFAEAKRHYERAIDLWDQVPDAGRLLGLDRVTLFERAAEVANLAGEHRRASTLISAAVDDLAPVGPGEPRDPTIRDAVLRQRLGRYLWASGDCAGALNAYQEAVHRIPSGLLSAERAKVEGAYAEALMLSGRYRLSHQQAEAALAVARAVGAELEGAQILATLGFDLAYLGDPSSGVAALEEARAIAEEVGDPDDIGRAYLNLAELLSGPLNRLAEAAGTAEAGVERVRQLGLQRSYGVALQAIAVNTLFRLGRWPEADRLLADAMALKPTGTPAIELCLARAKLSVGRGDFDAAARDLEAVEAISSGGIGPRYQAPLMTLRAAVELWRGRPQGARLAINEGLLASIDNSDDVGLLAPLLWHGLWAEADLADRARARRSAADVEEATTIAAGLQARVHRLAEQSAGAAPSIGQMVAAYVHLCDAEASRAAGRSSPEAWAEGAELWWQLDHPYPAAYASWRQAEALLAQRARSTRATEALQAAYRVAVTLGAEPFRRTLEELARRARITLTTVAAPVVIDAAGGEAPLTRAFPALSAREGEVLLLLAQGLSNREIGERLFISGGTVSVHLSHVFRKLDVKTRVQASLLVHQLGLGDGVGEQ